ncbi:GspH/FimT family pseudopilin [Aquincola sp. MAHUQ-54]|uniref:Type II secretion system protein H n=1 Tax=Aquincola agrisoli TaxID=3119538 RepID=A0AAW9QAT1_9BURK
MAAPAAVPRTIGRAKRRSRGLTFIEAVVVMGIVAAFAAVAMPAYNDLSARQKLAGASQQVADDLQEARSEAVQRNRRVYVSFRSGAQWCYAISLQPACDCAQPAAACALRRGDGQAFDGVGLPAARDTAFDPRLGLASTPAGVTLALGERTAEVQLAASGRARACARGADLPGLPRCS